MFSLSISESNRGFSIFFYFENNQELHLLGSANLFYIPESNLIELFNVCAFNGFGNCFFSILSMFVHTKDLFLVSERESSNRDPVYSNFDLLLENNDVSKVLINDSFNQYLEDLDNECELYGYNQKPNEFFNLINITEYNENLQNNDWNNAFSSVYESSDSFNSFSSIFPLDSNLYTSILKKLSVYFY